MLRASQFLAGIIRSEDWRLIIVDELPVRLAHRVKDLDHLPDKLHEMPSIQKVKHWYAQSFEVLYNLERESETVGTDSFS